MTNKDLIIVLETVKKNPSIDIREIHKFIDDKISWENLLKIFEYASTERFLKRDNLNSVITKLGENKLEELLHGLNDQQVELDKIKVDLRLKTWQLKTFWWIFGIAIVGFGLSTYNFINSLKPSSILKNQEMRIEKMEEDLSKIQTLILNQKSLDSLDNINDSMKTSILVE